MKSQNFKSGHQRFLDSLTASVESLEKESPSSTYNVTFALSLDQPFINKNASEVKSLIAKVALMVAQLDETTPSSLDLDVVEHNSVTAKIAIRTKESYESKQALTKGVQEGKVASIASAQRRKD